MRSAYASPGPTTHAAISALRSAKRRSSKAGAVSTDFTCTFLHGLRSKILGALAQDILLDFSGSRLRKLVDDLQPLRPELLGHAEVVEIALHGLEVENGAGLGDHEGARPLAQTLVRHGDDRDFADSRVPVEQLLDLRYGDFLAAAVDDVLDAPRDPDVAALVDDGEVAGTEPAVLRVRGLGPFGVVEIAGEHALAGDFEVPFRPRGEHAPMVVDDADLHAVERAPVSAPDLLRRITRNGGRSQARFRRAPCAADGCAERARRVLREDARHGGAGSHEDAQRRRGLRSGVDGFDDVGEERGSRLDERAAPLAQGRERDRGVPD